VFRRYHIIRKKPLTDAALLIQAGAEAERAAAEEAEEERPKAKPAREVTQ
jgi:hypothetical protein